MINFIFTTLAVGRKYFDKAIEFSNRLYAKDSTIKRIIVSDIIDTDIPKNTIILPLEDNSSTIICNTFNYNLKYQAIKACLNYQYNYIIYTDADWILSNTYESDKIYNFIEENNIDIDFFFERPHQIGNSKINWNECFWRHKIKPYKLLETNKYDEAHVPNEQFLLFKNNSKLYDFISAWESRNLFCINNNIWTFAEGVEIGMSSLDAGMLTKWSNFSTINRCFEFYDISGQHYSRF